MNKIVDWCQKINIDALFEIYGNPIQYVMKTGLKSLQDYLKGESASILSSLGLINLDNGMFSITSLGNSFYNAISRN